MKVLGLDTSSRFESVAIVEDGIVLIELQNSSKYKPSTEVFPLIQSVLTETHTSFSEIQALAVSIGPGSFTGLRVGLSVAKGLAFSLKKPLVAVSSLAAMARSSCVQGVIAPLMDARRGQIYASLYLAEKGNLTSLCDECVTEIENFCRLVSQKTVFFGDGAELFSGAIKSILGDRGSFFEKKLPHTVAGGVALLGKTKFERGCVEDINRLTPRYIRRSDAEISLRERVGVYACS